MDAERLATIAHEGQRDKSGAPYIEHPRRVAARVAEVGPGAAVDAAWLHDVAEDTRVTLADLARYCEPETLAVVDMLTRRKGEGERYYERVRTNRTALLVKLADVLDNTDPARVERLPLAVRERLANKYAAALDALLNGEG